MLMLFDLESLCSRQFGYFLEVLRNHHDIQIQADHRLDMGVNGEPPDHTISGAFLGKQVQEDLENILFSIGDAVQECFPGHRLNPSCLKLEKRLHGPKHTWGFIRTNYRTWGCSFQTLGPSLK